MIIVQITLHFDYWNTFNHFYIICDGMNLCNTCNISTALWMNFDRPPVTSRPPSRYITTALWISVVFPIIIVLQELTFDVICVICCLDYKY